MVIDPSGNTAALQNFTGQNFAKNQSHSYTVTLQPAVAGTYTVKIGVFSSTWQLWNWNSSAGTITVTSSLTFAASASANPATIKTTGTSNISATVTDTGTAGLTNAIVELQVFNQSGVAVATTYWTGQNSDLYIYFYARAHELLRPGGVAAFISSNKWLRAGYGEALRRHLLDDQAFRLVMDFGELPVFESAATDAAVFLWQKQPRADAVTRWAMVKDLDRCYAGGVRDHFRRLCVEAVPAAQFGAG